MVLQSCSGNPSSSTTIVIIKCAGSHVFIFGVFGHEKAPRSFTPGPTIAKREQELNALVYELYILTNEEVKIAEEEQSGFRVSSLPAKYGGEFSV